MNAVLAGLMCVVFVAESNSLLADENGSGTQRARPPQWPAEVRDVFFEDARQQLIGARPDYEGAASIAEDNRPRLAPDAQAAPVRSSWSEVIDAETLEAEIKRLAAAVAADVTTPGAFKAGAYQRCRQHFSLLAALFAVIAEYDGEVRWQDVAPGLREAFARAGYNCKVGTDQTFREALERRQDVAELIRGSRTRRESAERTADWSRVADRSPLMQRLETSHQDRLLKWLVNERQFAQHGAEVRHEAQLIAMIADVIGREGFDYWDDEEYAKYARELRSAATDISVAVDLDNYQQSREALNRATNACTNCHEAYRG